MYEDFGKIKICRRLYFLMLIVGERPRLEWLLVILLKIPPDEGGWTGYHDGSCCDRLVEQTADTHLLSSDQDGNMDIWMIYYRQTLTWKLGEVRITTISQDNLHLVLSCRPEHQSGIILLPLSRDVRLGFILRNNCPSRRAVGAALQHFLADLLSFQTGGGGGTARPWNRELSISLPLLTHSLSSPDRLSHFSAGL